MGSTASIDVLPVMCCPLTIRCGTFISGPERRAENGTAPDFYCGKRMSVESGTGQGGLDIRRKRLQFRAWHRGLREVDLLLGRFADATIASLDETELSSFEALLDIPDPDVLSWITGEAGVPAEADSPLLRRIYAFHGTIPYGEPAPE